jgi:hypothetical protein
MFARWAAARYGGTVWREQFVMNPAEWLVLVVLARIVRGLQQLEQPATKT